MLADLNGFDPQPHDLLDIVTYADMTTSPSDDPISAAERVSEILSRYRKDHSVHDALSQSAPTLLAAVDDRRAALGRSAHVGQRPALGTVLDADRA